MRESTIEKRVCDAARTAGWLVHPKAAAGHRGWPDRTFTKADRVVFIEFKAPGKKPTALQSHTHDQLRQQGYAVYVIDDAETGCGVFL